MVIGTLFVVVALIVIAIVISFMVVSTQLEIHNFDYVIDNIFSIPFSIWIGIPFLIGLCISFFLKPI